MAGFAEELRRIPMSQGLGATLARAADYAQAQQHGEVALEHLLLALTEDDDAGQVLAASHVDLALLTADVSSYLGGLPGGGVAGQVSLALDLKRILEAAAAAASQGRRREINGAIVLAAIVGDGRSAAAHMLRSQGLTFEEAIKALQRALAPAPQPAPAPTKLEKPDAEDILATARARVQTRAAPGLPPVAPRPEPIVEPVVDVKPEPVAAKAEPVVVASKPEPLPVKADPIVDLPPVAPVAPTPSWPPEVRSSEPGTQTKAPVVDFDAVQAEIEAARYREAAQVLAPSYEPEEPAYDQTYDDAPDPGVNDFGEASRYATPLQAAPQLPMPMPPMLPPMATIPPPAPSRYAQPHAPPSPGSRWPAPVAPAWRDQQDAYRIAEEAALPPAPPSLPPPFAMEHGGASMAPLPPVEARWDEPPHPAAPAGTQHGWPGPDLTANPAGYDQRHQPYDGRHDMEFGAHFPPPAPPPMSWPEMSGPDMTGAGMSGPGPGALDHSSPNAFAHNGHGYVEAGPQPDHGYGGEQQNYDPSWPHQEAAPHWGEAGDGSAGYADEGGPSLPAVTLPLQESGGPADRQPAARARRRRSADRPTAGHMGESIPRKMRVNAASSVDVRLTKAEFLGLLDGLSEETDYGVETGCLSVKLRAPDGQFMIDPVSPETQWADVDAGFGTSDSVSWRWTVTPLKSGRRRLQLAVSVRTPSVAGPAAVTALPEQIITVRVGRNYGRGLAKLLGWIAIAVVGGLFAKYGLPLLDPVIAEVLKLMK